MKPKYYILIIIIAVILLGAWFTWDNFKKGEVKKCGDVVLKGYLITEGYLVTDCRWLTYLILPDVKSTLHPNGPVCQLDIWLSENETASLETCEKFPFTSKCFLEKVSLFDPWNLGRPNFFRPKVTLIGKYEKIEVCDDVGLVERGAECDKKNVFVPCELKIDETQVIKDPKLKYQQILYNPKSKYCEVDEDCDIAWPPVECCPCPEAFNKEYAEEINKLPLLCIPPEVICKQCPYDQVCPERECIKCVNSACKIVFPTEVE